jgi:hypothetical protein
VGEGGLHPRSLGCDPVHVIVRKVNLLACRRHHDALSAVVHRAPVSGSCAPDARRAVDRTTPHRRHGSADAGSPPALRTRALWRARPPRRQQIGVGLFTWSRGRSFGGQCCRLAGTAQGSRRVPARGPRARAKGAVPTQGTRCPDHRIWSTRPGSRSMPDRRLWRRPCRCAFGRYVCVRNASALSGRRKGRDVSRSRHGPSVLERRVLCLSRSGCVSAHDSTKAVAEGWASRGVRAGDRA